MKKLLSVLFISTLLLTSCSSEGAITNLGSQEFASKIAEPGVIVLDVRTAAEFIEGHLENAINVDVEGSQFEMSIAQLDKTKSYAVYCRSGRRSGIAVEKMNNAGFTSLFNLDVGIIDWQNQGLPVVQ
ncbi:MAG: rhodanese-like domain-containing protein [Candidatus Planktophila sp.]|jgi:rhodanese-related sulfurtransferase